MNIDTKYLIRWAIPGWIMIMIVSLYWIVKNPILITDFDTKTAPGLLAIGAFLGIIGLPIGYILNQIHHTLFWVMWIKWNKYFEKEINLHNKFYGDHNKGDKERERYRYLLSRIHELGGILFGIIFSMVFCLLDYFNLIFNHRYIWFFSTFVFVLIIILINRIYFARNLIKYEESILRRRP